MSKNILYIDYDGNSTSVYCPVCGKGIHGENIVGPGCKHVVFLYLDETAEFSYLRREYIGIGSDVVKNCKKDSSYPPESLLEKIAKESIFSLVVTSCGTESDSEAQTWAVGIDFCPKKPAA